MSFKNLSERFEANAAEIYAKHSARVNKDGTQNLEPFIETKPDDTSRPDLSQQSRSSPDASIEVDTRRMEALGESPRGLQWYLNQSFLQTGNTFAETRELNPDFVINNIDPFVKDKRATSKASLVEIADNGNVPSPVLRTNVGGAGRLQLHTSQRTTGLVIEGEANNFYQKIVKRLPIASVGGRLAKLAYGSPGEILGVNQRPELDMDGTGLYNSYYSTQVWLGFQKNDDRIENIERIRKNLRNRNVVGAIRSIGRAITDITGTIDSVLEGEIPAGKRYFITGPTEADRYLDGTVDFTPEGPRASLRLGRDPVVRDSVQRIRSHSPSEDPNGSFVTDGEPQFEQIGTTQSRIGRFVDRVVNGMDTVNRFAGMISAQNAGRQIQNALLDKLRRGDDTAFNPEDQSAEEKMLDSGRYSMRRRYTTDDEWETLRNNITSQKEVWRNSILDSLNDENRLGHMGYRGGIRVGEELDSTEVRYISSYSSDPVNSLELKKLEEDATHISAEEIERNREDAPTLVDLYFFDYVNRVSVPFRAYLIGFSETVIPEYTETPYIGRIERNIVYNGVKREAQFTLLVHAFNHNELIDIWRRIHYLTGMCYPAKYSNGFMVPPLSKLTLGDIYNNQPGYISSVTHNINDETPWETAEEWQVPHGMEMNISYTIIEKGQMETFDFNPRAGFSEHIPFYAYGQPRSVSHRSIAADPIDMPDFNLERDLADNIIDRMILSRKPRIPVK